MTAPPVSVSMEERARKLVQAQCDDIICTFLDLESCGCMREVLVALAAVRNEALEEAAALARGHTIVSGSPGPLYTAGANQNAEWIANEIRALKTKAPEGK